MAEERAPSQLTVAGALTPGVRILVLDEDEPSLFNRLKTATQAALSAALFGALLTVAPTGYVGIGTAAPVSPFHVQSTTAPAPTIGAGFLSNTWGASTDATAVSFGTNMTTFYHTHTNGSANARQPRGVYVSTNYLGAGVNASSSQGALIEATTDPTFSGSLGSNIALVLQSIRNGSAGNITSTTGLAGLSVNAYSFSGAGTISIMQGVMVTLAAIGANHTVLGDVRGINILQPSLGTATVGGNLVGLYVPDMSLGGGVVTGKRYAIYAGGGQSFFRDWIGIGNAFTAPETPSAPLEILTTSVLDTLPISLRANTVWTNPSNNGTQAIAASVSMQIDGAQDTGAAVVGGKFNAFTLSTRTGAVGTLIGGWGVAIKSNAVGTVTTAEGLRGGLSINTAGLVTDAAGLRSQLAIGGSAQITNLYGARITRPTVTVGAAMDKVYGLYLDDFGTAISGAAAQWALYVAGGASHLGAGPVYLLSPNGSRWAVTVSNAGALVVTAA